MPALMAGIDARASRAVLAPTPAPIQGRVPEVVVVLLIYPQWA
jgi:hypothetical protein